MSNNNKKKLFFATAAVMVTSVFFCEHHFHPKYKILNSEEAFAEYSNGVVYIGDIDYIKLIKEDVNENDILVVDERNTDDPNMLIYNSYRITSKEERNEILCILEEYERLYPSEWNRSIESMRNEWQVHNLFYLLNYKLDHTTDVDLNNEDEEIFNNYILSRVLNN